MSSDLMHLLPAEERPEDLIEAGTYLTQDEGFEHGLVVLAAGKAFWLVPSDGGYRLLVEPTDVLAVREQLACFNREAERRSSSITRMEPAGKMEWVTPLLWALVVIAIFRAQHAWPALQRAGVLDAHAVFGQGEWWRVASALFLHADSAHLISNTLSGVAVFAAVLSTFGRARGWLLLALAGIGGNLAAVALNFHGEYHSLGASTVIFGAVGLLTGRAIRLMRKASLHRWRAMFMPLATGITVLGLFGAGDVHVDAIAHATGFTAGVLLGWVGSNKSRSKSVRAD